MFRYRFLRSAAFALAAYGVLGLFIGGAMLLVGYTAFDQVTRLSAALEREREIEHARRALLEERAESGERVEALGGFEQVRSSRDGRRGSLAQARPPEGVMRRAMTVSVTRHASASASSKAPISRP